MMMMMLLSVVMITFLFSRNVNLNTNIYAERSDLIEWKKIVILWDNYCCSLSNHLISQKNTIEEVKRRKTILDGSLYCIL